MNYAGEHPGYLAVGAMMRACTDLYWRDLVEMGVAHLSADEIFAWVAALPYAYDSEIVGIGAEMLTRPKRIREFRGIDCKKKAILIGSWGRANGFPYRYVAVDDTGAGISHVFAQVKMNGAWVNMDATIQGHSYPGGPLPLVRYAEVL